MDDHRRDMPNVPDLLDQPVIGLEKTAVYKIMALDAGQRVGMPPFRKLMEKLGIEDEAQRRGFPSRPRGGGLFADRGVRRGQTPVVSMQKIASFGKGDR